MSTNVATATGAAAQLDTSGTYLLQNARGSTMLDMSNDYKTIHGIAKHGQSNQQWEFIPSAGLGNAICCVRRSEAEGYPMYLMVGGVPDSGAAIIASPYPVNWNVETADGVMRISWPNSQFVITLADGGSGANGTQIELAPLNLDDQAQVWNYTTTQRARLVDQK